LWFLIFAIMFFFPTLNFVIDLITNQPFFKYYFFSPFSLSLLFFFSLIFNQCCFVRQASKPGFRHYQEKPFLGASLDVVTECDCCGKSAAELKCPVAQDNYTRNGKLPNTHRYYYQVMNDLRTPPGSEIKRCRDTGHTTFSLLFQ